MTFVKKVRIIGQKELFEKAILLTQGLGVKIMDINYAQDETSSWFFVVILNKI